jgi:hypothetical protein
MLNDILLIEIVLLHSQEMIKKFNTAIERINASFEKAIGG